MFLTDHGTSFLFFFVFHIFTFIVGLTVCGLYGVDLTAASQQGVERDRRWAFAVAVGALSAGVSMVYAIPICFRYIIPYCSVVMFIISTVLFGMFGAMFIKEDPEGNNNIQRMKNAVWVDLMLMLLWFISSGSTFIYVMRNREHRTRFTGRAQV